MRRDCLRESIVVTLLDQLDATKFRVTDLDQECLIRHHLAEVEPLMVGIVVNEVGIASAADE